MKLDIEALVREANNLAIVAIVANPATHEGWDRERMKAFARLIVERCAAECENYAIKAAFDGEPENDHEGAATYLADKLRQLLEDK